MGNLLLLLLLLLPFAVAASCPVVCAGVLKPVLKPVLKLDLSSGGSVAGEREMCCSVCVAAACFVRSVCTA